MPSCDLDYRKINVTLRQLRSKLINLAKNANRLKAIAGSKEQTTQIEMITLQSEKLIESLKEHYKDTVEKLTLKTHTPSLISLAGYAVGTNAASVHEERIEEFYENIPAHLRQFVLLQHATDTLIRSEMILPHLPKFIDVCSNGRAIYQGYRLLQYYWNSKVTLLSTDQQFVATKMIQLGKAEAWTRLQAEHLVYHSKSRRVLGTDGIEVLLQVLKIYNSGNSECYKALNEACMYLLEHSMRYQRTARSFKKRKFSYSSDPLESSDSEWEDSRSTVLTHQNCQCNKVFDLFFEKGLFKNLSNDCQLLFVMWSIYSIPRRRKEMVDILPQIIALVDCSKTFKKLNWKPKHIIFVAEHCRTYPVVSYTLLRAILTVFEGMQFPNAIEKVTQAIMELKDCSAELCTKINEANLILSRVNVINAPNQLITYFEIEDLLRTPLPKNLSTNVEFETVGSGLSPMTNIKSHNISRPEDFADPLTAITTVQRLKLASLEKSKTIEYDEFKSISRKLKRDSGFVESPIPLKLNEKRKFLRGPSSDVTVTDYGDVSDDEKDLKYEIDDLLC